MQKKASRRLKFRGLLITINSMERYSQPTPIAEAMKTDPELRKLLDKITRGEISLCSPFPGMEKPWTEEDKERLSQALSNFGWK
jgi:hypothetical protein